MSITAKMVQDLRARTGAGMMDCKKALTETAGDMEASIDWLRKKGHATASKKAGRVAAEGVVSLSVSNNKGIAIEVNSETDFVARNEEFQEFVKNITTAAMDCDSFSDLENAIYPGTDKSIKDEVINKISTIGENITLRRFDKISVKNGVICSYIHNIIAGNCGKIAVLIGLESNADQDKLNSLGKQIAMHIAAAKPDVLNIADVSQDNLDREKQIFSEQARASGKPDSIIEKMVGGRIKKYYQEVVLLEQVFVVDNKTKISDLLSDFAKDNGSEVKINKFIRFELGEGVTTSEE